MPRMILRVRSFSSSIMTRLCRQTAPRFNVKRMGEAEEPVVALDARQRTD
jgi:hypothetical protein